jgi:hypothetical protein
MSALPAKADIAERNYDVHFVPKPDTLKLTVGRGWPALIRFSTRANLEGDR